MNDMGDINRLLDRAQTAEAALNTARRANKAVAQEAQTLKQTFGIRRKGNGSYQVDFAVFLRGLGFDGYVELRGIGDQMYGVSGEIGDKARISVRAATNAPAKLADGVAA